MMEDACPPLGSSMPLHSHLESYWLECADFKFVLNLVANKQGSTERDKEDDDAESNDERSNN